MKQLKDKVIIVTGGAGLIGKTVVNGINDNGGLAICADISGIPSYEHNFIGDITSELSVKEMFEEATNKYGVIHGLVNSAYPRTSDWGLDFSSIPYSSWQKNVDMQLNSCFYVNQQFIEIAREQKKPVSIINIASIYGIVGPDFSIYGNTGMTTPAAYTAIKGAIINFTRYLAARFGPDGVRVNCISPGGVFDNQAEVFVENYSRKVPLRRMARPEDIAPGVCFLLSDEAGYITGHNLVIDGGWTAI